MSTQIISVDDGFKTKSAISANSANATVFKVSAGNLMGWYISNINATQMYVKLYDKATAPSSSDTPLVRLAIPGSSTGAGTNVAFPLGGISFLNGIGYRIVTGSADNDNTSVAASDVIVNFFYR